VGANAVGANVVEANAVGANAVEANVVVACAVGANVVGERKPRRCVLARNIRFIPIGDIRVSNNHSIIQKINLI
jgi:hypothetical protein